MSDSHPESSASSAAFLLLSAAAAALLLSLVTCVRVREQAATKKYAKCCLRVVPLLGPVGALGDERQRRRRRASMASAGWGCDEMFAARAATCGDKWNV